MIDAYVLRSIHRRCNYSRAAAIEAQAAILGELDLRYRGYTDQVTGAQEKLAYYIAQYERSGIADITIMPFIKDGRDTQFLSTLHLDRLANIIEGMLAYKPFPVIAIHDEFKCHANNMNYLRQQYINILAELADGDLLSDIMSQVYGVQGTYPKLSKDLGDKIRGSNYALC